MLPSTNRLIFTFKCSISLGLAVLFGTIFSKENGYWSGLTIAISFATGRQPIFTVANARAQGTTMVNGVNLRCCGSSTNPSQKELRIGCPDEFAITRLTEAFIGLSCLIMVEFVLQRARAVTLARNQLSRSLKALEECIQHIVFLPTKKKSLNLPYLRS
ncbi:hypothetical protein POM88_022423 [Heracleum sosnowskyi]|uniref:Uncharacterized protein n=1 Tax=Heracleum sosnowskyi TaxID=360622 RepID=A0AAD8IHP3_9APIA|nr:hypothetical protein POM88_022423 [Heracleum sosnowskyi]